MTLGAALRLHAATSRLTIADVVATRVLLETWAVEEAARRSRSVTPPDLADAESLLDAMDRAVEEAPEDAARFHRLDAEFHVALAAAAGNAVVEAWMASLREAIHEYVMAAVPALPSWPTTVARLRDEHRTVLGLVRAGSRDGAAAAVRTHIEGFYAEASLG